MILRKNYLVLSINNFPSMNSPIKTSELKKILSTYFKKAGENRNYDIYTNVDLDLTEISTVELSSGLQISGVFSKIISANNQPIYLQTTGKSALSHNYIELANHSKLQHPQGFGTALGKLIDSDLPIEVMSLETLSKYGIIKDEVATLKFEGGIVVKGSIKKILRSSEDKIIIITFENCSVALGELILFDPTWGFYDMAVGENVIDVFVRAADSKSFDITGNVEE